VALVFSFAYPKFLNTVSDNPPYIYSFVLMHMVVVFIVGAFVVPRFLNILIPSHRLERGDGKFAIAPQVTMGQAPIMDDGGLEGGNIGHHDSVRGSVDAGKTNLGDGTTTAGPALMEQSHK
jgi:solute carrier family 6 (neurotransmitter transporter, GABA) member 1